MPSNSREPDMVSKSSPQQTKKTSMETLNEPLGSTTRSALHRRKSSINLQKTQSIAIKSEVSWTDYTTSPSSSDSLSHIVQTV